MGEFICPSCKNVIGGVGNNLTASGGSTSQAVSAAPPASRGHSLQDSSRPESSIDIPPGMEILGVGDEIVEVRYVYPGDKETMDMIWDNSRERGWGEI